MDLHVKMRSFCSCFVRGSGGPLPTGRALCGESRRCRHGCGWAQAHTFRLRLCRLKVLSSPLLYTRMYFHFGMNCFRENGDASDHLSYSGNSGAIMRLLLEREYVLD
jgi:hypothetical protein